MKAETDLAVERSRSLQLSVHYEKEKEISVKQMDKLKAKCVDYDD